MSYRPLKVADGWLLSNHPQWARTERVKNVSDAMMLLKSGYLLDTTCVSFFQLMKRWDVGQFDRLFGPVE